jgi:hypothetical protein
VRGAWGRIAKRGKEDIPESQDPDWLLWQLEQFTGRVVKKHGVDSVEAARAQVELSLQLGKMRRWEEARVLREGSLNTFRKHRGEDDPETLQTELCLAVALAHTGRLPESEVHLRHAASSSLVALGPDHEVTRVAQGKLDEFRRSQPSA